MRRLLLIPRSCRTHIKYLLFTCALVSAFVNPSDARPSRANDYQQGVYLVFPFENAGASTRHEWLSQGLEELSIQLLSAAGEEIYSRQALAKEQDRGGLLRNSRLSRASMLHIAEELDADYIVTGRFRANDSSLTIEARILNVNSMTLQAPIQETGSLDSLMELQTRLVWRLLNASSRSYPHTIEEFTRMQHPVRLDAFEHYVRGVIAGEDEVRIRELKEAARLEPGWPQPDFALGMTYFTRRDCGSALPWYARVPKVHERYVEAVFATGVCRLIEGEPEKAEGVFAGLLRALQDDPAAGSELPAILNNLGVAGLAWAQARQRKRI
jgi:TolB-like protein